MEFLCEQDDKYSTHIADKYGSHLRQLVSPKSIL